MTCKHKGYLDYVWNYDIDGHTTDIRSIFCHSCGAQIK